MTDNSIIPIFCLISIFSTGNVGLANDFVIDVCRFRGDDGRVFLELYVDLPRSSITYEQDSEDWSGIVNFQVEIQRNEEILVTDRWQVEDHTAHPDSVSTAHELIDLRMYDLAPNTYDFSAVARDSLSGRSWQASQTVLVESFPEDEFSFSEIELASVLLPPDILPKFDRGDFALLPNPRRLIGNPRTYFYYYFELYQPPEADSDKIITLRRTILNSTHEIVTELPSIQFNAGKSISIDMDSVSVSHLPTQSYTFAVDAACDGEPVASRHARFHLFNPAVPNEPPPSIESYRMVDSAAVEEELDEISFLLTNAQRKVLKGMTIENKAQFLDDFWKSYDDDLNTPDVPARRLYQDRIEKADEKWSNYRESGHKTDRGRIYVLYGDPSFIEAASLHQEAKPHQIWTYDRLEGGVIFVFVDRSGLGEYELVHSTKRGEIRNEDWYNVYVKRSGIDSGR